MRENDRVEIILEEVRGQYQAMQEGIDALRDVPQRLDRLETKVDSIQIDMHALKEVVPLHSAILQDHEKRVTTLESNNGPGYE